MLKALGIPTIAKGSHRGGSDTSNGFYFRNKDIIIITGNNPITGKYRNKNRDQKRITHLILVSKQKQEKIWIKL